MKIELLNGKILDAEDSQIIGGEIEEQGNEKIYYIKIKQNVFSRTMFRISRERYNKLFGEVLDQEIKNEIKEIPNDNNETKNDDELKENRFEIKSKKRGRPRKK